MENISFKRKPVFLKFRMVISLAGDRPAEERMKETQDVYISPSCIVSFFPCQGFQKTHTQLFVAGSGFYVVEGDAEDVFLKIVSCTQDELKGTMAGEWEQE